MASRLHMITFILFLVSIMMITPETAGAPEWIKPHINAKLKNGWAFDELTSTFISKDGSKFDPKKALPSGFTIRYTAPNLAQRDRKTLSDSERNLALYFQIIFPRDTETLNFLDIIRQWPCVSDAQEAPKISLP